MVVENEGEETKRLLRMKRGDQVVVENETKETTWSFERETEETKWLFDNENEPKWPLRVKPTEET